MGGSNLAVVTEEDGFDGDEETQQVLSIHGGYYFGDSTALTVAYAMNTLETDSFEYDSTSYEAELKTVQAIGSSMWLGGFVSYADTIDSDLIAETQTTAVGVMFYPHRKVALGLAREEIDYSGFLTEETQELTAAVSFSSKVRLDVSVSETEYDNSLLETETVEANLNILF